jgi:hypothetical protein
MSVKDDRGKASKYTKNYTKIFKDWVESRTPVPNYIKKKNVEKAKK